MGRIRKQSIGGIDMRILVKGQYKEIEYKHTCERCGTVLAAKECDTENGISLVCPICGGYIMFSYEEPIIGEE